MIKKAVSVALLLMAISGGRAAPPEIHIDPVVTAPATGYLVVKPRTDAASVVYVSPSLDPFPSEFLSDKTVFIVPVRGLPAGEYQVWAVAASKIGEQRLVAFVVRVGKVPVPVDPPPPPPPTSLYFAIIRPDGPASPDFTRVMSDAAWGQLQKKGHRVKDFSIAEITALGFRVPPGTPLPAVLTLRSEGGETSILRHAVSLPATTAEILSLEKLP